MFRRFTVSISFLWELFKIALSSLRSNKLRTFLTLLGIIVGVTSVIAVVTIINGLNQSVSSTFSSQGSTVFTVSRRPMVITSREDLIKFNKRKEVTQDDAEAIKRLCSLCWRISYSINGRENVKGSKESENVPISGATISEIEIQNYTIQSGRLWTDSEENSGQNVAIVGADILSNTLEDISPQQSIGREIRVGGESFRIIGVFDKLGSVFGNSRDNFVMIPFPAGEKLFGSRDSLVVNVQIQDSRIFEDAKDQVRTIMRNRRGKILTVTNGETEEDEGFTVESQDVFIGLYQTATSNIYLVVLFVAGISLVVGGIVVMNIMLVSVTERTKEIGIRKSLGARQRDILNQFLIEALTVTAIGGLIGVLTGFGLAGLISLLIGFPMQISVNSALLGVGMSTTVGLISGIYPAWKAAKLNPIEALSK